MSKQAKANWKMRYSPQDGKCYTLELKQLAQPKFDRLTIRSNRSFLLFIHESGPFSLKCTSSNFIIVNKLYDIDMRRSGGVNRSLDYLE